MAIKLPPVIAAYFAADKKGNAPGPVSRYRRNNARENTGHAGNTTMKGHQQYRREPNKAAT